MNTEDERMTSYSKKIIAMFYLAAIFLVYSPTIIFSYAFSDDWSTLSDVFSGKGSPFQWDMQSGRPLYAVARRLAFTLVHNIDDLAYLRFFTVISVFMLCFFLFSFIEKRNIFERKITTIVFPLLICLTPAVQVYNSWATCFPFVLSILLAGISYATLKPINKKTTIIRFAASVIILWFAFAIYQPTAMAFLFFVMLDNCLKKDKPFSINIVLISGAALFIGMLGSLLFSKFIPVWLYGSSIARAELTNNPLEKLRWFIKEPLINAINNFNITPGTFFTTLSLIICAIGLLSIIKGKSGPIKVLMFIIMGIGAYSPNLLVKENWAAYRSLIALEFFTCALIIIGLDALTSKLNIAKKALPLLTVFAMIAASYNIFNGFIIPQKSELNALASALSYKVGKTFTGDVLFDIQDPAYNAFTKTQRYDEFGNISLAAPWAIKGMAEQILISKSMHFRLPDNVILTAKEQCATDCIIIKTGDAMRSSTSNY